MGMPGLFRRSECSLNEEKPPLRINVRITSATNNPDPDNFVIECYEEIGKYLIAEIRYPDCTNFEGRKILVYKNLSVKRLLAIRSLDPHFCSERAHIHPIARFVPTKKGWEYARIFCSATEKERE